MYKLESTTQFKKAYQGWESFKIIQAIEQGAMIQCPLQFVSKTIKNNNMKNIRAFALFLLLTFTGMCLNAQVSPVTWTFKTVKINDSVAELQLKADIEQNWHLYSQYTKGIELPIVFKFDKSAQYKLLGKVIEPKYIEETDDFGTARFFNHQVTFKQRVQILDNKPFTIKGKLEGQACKDGRCTQVEQKFAFDIKGYDKVAKSNDNDLDNDTEQPSILMETP